VKSLQDRLSKAAVPRLLLSFAGPAVIGLLCQALYNIVDRIFVGQFVGPEGLAALTMAFPVMLLMFGFSLLFGSGSATLISKYMGESNFEKAEKTLGSMFASLIIFAVFFVIAGLLFLEPLLILLGAKGSLLEQSIAYLRIIMMASPFIMGFALDYTIRGEGNPKFPAMVIIISSVINIILDFIMIKVLGMGISGAALATAISESIAGFLLISYYLSGKSVIKLHLKNIRLQKSFLLPILSLGFAPFIMDAASSIQNMVANKMLITYGGEYGVAAMGIVFAVNMICLLVALGIGDGMQPIISFNHGAKATHRVNKTLIYAIFFVEIIAVLVLILVEVFPNIISGFFVNNNPDLSAVAVIALRIFAISIPFFSFQIIGVRYFQAIHQRRLATISAILRQLVIFIPAIYLMGKLFGLNGIWISFPISDFFAAMITVFMIKRFHDKRIGGGALIRKLKLN